MRHRVEGQYGSGIWPHRRVRVAHTRAYLSGETLGKSTLFSGLTWERSEARRTNWPTQEEKLQAMHARGAERISQVSVNRATVAGTHAPRKALKGKSVMRTQ